MSHRDAWMLLDQFLDGALPARERWAVAAHFNDCPACRGYVAEQARLRGIVREHLDSPEPPPEMTQRLRTALAMEGAIRPAARPVRPLPVRGLRLAALLGPAAAALWLFTAIGSPFADAPTPRASELAAVHSLFAQDESLLDVIGDGEAVRRWFRDGVGLEIATPALAGYELVGSRLIVLNGKPAAQLVYESSPGDSYLSLLQYQSEVPGASQYFSSLSATTGPMSIVTWDDHRQSSALVAALPDAELRRIAAGLAP